MRDNDVMNKTMDVAETRRLEAVAALHVLDTPRDDRFDELAARAAALFDAPVALITLIDADRQWFKARLGTDLCETERQFSFCEHAIRTPDRVMVVPDATLDPRFKANPYVVAGPKFRFYAGAPLITRSGAAVGTLCVLGCKPMGVEPDHIELIQYLARQVMRLMEPPASAASAAD
ncbi:MAG: GAF domain-containing protein [Comamonadaceae bacterium]|nr:MAG: GAF domain-containing protein [Comamonadaceae bacterium]